MSTLGTSLKGFGEGKRATERKHMEALLSEFTQCYDDWPCAKVAKFAQAVCGFSKDQADRLQREKIDLVTLADMSREEIVHVTNCAWGDARRLKKALETFVDKAAMFEQEALTCDSKKTLLLPTVPISKERLTEKSLLVPQSKSQQDCVSTVLPKPSFRAQNRTRGCLDGDQKLKKASRADSPTKISAGRSQLSGRSSAGSLRVPISYAPVSCALDPVLREDHTGRSLVERLSERVWAVKPKEEEPAQWGSDYVSEFHPGAKESYINVFRKLRKEFENLGEEVVIAAWRENFRYNRQAEQDTLRYIEKICLDLPSVPFIVSGAAVELRPDPLFILKNWFTTHKKHHRRRRLAEINNSVQSIALETQADDNPEKAHCTQVELPDVPDAGDEQCVFSPEKPRQRRVQEDHLSGQLNITSAPVSVTYGTDLGERVKIHAYSYSLIVEEDVICIDKQLRRSVEPLALRALHQKIIQFSIPIGVGVITEILQEVPYLMYEVKVESILSDYSLSTWYSWEAPFMQQMLRKGLRVRIPAVFLLIHDEEGLCDKSLAMFDESLGFRLYTPGRLDSSKVLDTTKIGTQSEKVEPSSSLWNIESTGGNTVGSQKSAVVDLRCALSQSTSLLLTETLPLTFSQSPPVVDLLKCSQNLPINSISPESVSNYKESHVTEQVTPTKNAENSANIACVPERGSEELQVHFESLKTRPNSKRQLTSLYERDPNTIPNKPITSLAQVTESVTGNPDPSLKTTLIVDLGEISCVPDGGDENMTPSSDQVIPCKRTKLPISRQQSLMKDKKTLDSPVAQPTVLALETQDHGGKPSGYTPEVHVQKQGVEEDESVPARSKRPVTRSSKGGLSGTLQTNLKQVKKRRQNQEKEMGCSEPRLSQFDEDGKLTIAMHAMKLRKKQDVFGTLAKFMAEKNKKHKENATTSKLPFVHHSGISSTGQLDLVVDWALQNKIDLVNLVSPENGVIRLYKHNIQFKEKKYE